MTTSSDSIRIAQMQLSAAVDRTIDALRTALREAEAVAAVTRASTLDSLTLQRLMTEYQSALATLINVSTKEQETSREIARNIRP